MDERQSLPLLLLSTNHGRRARRCRQSGRNDMKSFAYAAASRIEDALDVDGVGVMRIAGGTELLNWMRLGISAPDLVVDVGKIPDLNGIERQGDQLVIGGLATLNAVGENDLVRRHATVLSEACLKAAA